MAYCYNYDEVKYFSSLAQAMDEKEKEARDILRLIVHPKHVDGISKLLAWGVYEEQENALTLANDLNISDAHVFALLNFEEDFVNASFD